MEKSQKKVTWVKESGFIFAMIGSAVGFANLLSFSALCYKNGGGAFLIPFLAANLVIGLPVLFLEGAIGKTYGLPIVSAYGKRSKHLKVMGWISALSCLTIGAFYSVLTSWSVAYTYYSATNKIPEDSARFFKVDFLRDSGAITVFNGLSPTLVIATLLVLLFTYLVMAKNVAEGVEKVCGFFMPLLFAIVLVFAIIVAFLPGAFIGFKSYLEPDFSRLTDFALWRDVFGQVFFSYSLGIGIMVGYARHAKKETNLRRAMIWVAVGDGLVSLVAGFAIFGCVGFMSYKTGIPFDNIVKSDSSFEMGFIVFPQILHVLADWLRPLVGTIFFFCVFIAGITGVFSIVESVAGNIEVEFGYDRKASVGITIVLMFFFSLFFCGGNGTHILGAIAPMVLGYTFLLGGISEIIVFMYLDKTVSSDAVFLNRHASHTTLFFIAKYAGLGFLILSLLGALVEEFSGQFDIANAVRWSWFLVVLVLSFLAAEKGRDLAKISGSHS